MRIAQKKQAEEFVEMLGQAHEEIRNAIEKKNIPAAMSLLADCQDGAIALGDLIENAEGERAATIPLLESYCELVYGIHQSLGAEMSGPTRHTRHCARDISVSSTALLMISRCGGK